MFLLPVIIIVLLSIIIMVVLNVFSNPRQQTIKNKISAPPLLARPKSPEDDADENCSICLDSLITHDNVLGCLSTKCNHNFHTKCLLKWFKRRGDAQCPLCRTRVKDNDLVSFPDGSRMLKVVTRRLRRFFNYSARLQQENQQDQQEREELETLSTETEQLRLQSQEILSDLERLERWTNEFIQSYYTQRDDLTQRCENVRQRFVEIQQRRDELDRRLHSMM